MNLMAGDTSQVVSQRTNLTGLVACYAVAMCLISIFPSSIAASVTSSDHLLSSLVRISTDTGSAGSGFIVKMDGRKYILTNQHVLHGASRISLKTINNVELRPITFSFSLSRDLARMELPSVKNESISCLEISKTAPRIGSHVRVYGNSEGSGAFTELKGKLLGVGPDVVETDAEFVRGNSGSPIVNEVGEVVAIATYVVKGSTEDWVTKGTRFEKIRRYGIRLNCDDWMYCRFDRYAEVTHALVDIDRYLWQIAEIIRGSLSPNSIDKRTVTFINKYDFRDQRDAYHDESWSRQVDNFCRAFTRDQDKIFFKQRGNNYSAIGKGKILKRLADRLEQMVSRAEAELAGKHWPGALLQQEVEYLNELAEALRNALKDSSFLLYEP